MLKTNSKKARENVRDYVLKKYNEAQCDSKTQALNFNEAATSIFNEFIKVEANLIKKIGVQCAFNYFASGLPFCGMFGYYLNTAVKTVAEWLEQTETESAKYTQEKAEILANYLILSELQKAIK